MVNSGARVLCIVDNDTKDDTKNYNTKYQDQVSLFKSYSFGISTTGCDGCQCTTEAITFLIARCVSHMLQTNLQYNFHRSFFIYLFISYITAVAILPHFARTRNIQ